MLGKGAVLQDCAHELRGQRSPHLLLNFYQPVKEQKNVPSGWSPRDFHRFLLLCPPLAGLKIWKRPEYPTLFKVLLNGAMFIFYVDALWRGMFVESFLMNYEPKEFEWVLATPRAYFIIYFIWSMFGIFYSTKVKDMGVWLIAVMMFVLSLSGAIEPRGGAFLMLIFIWAYPLFLFVSFVGFVLDAFRGDPIPFDQSVPWGDKEKKWTMVCLLLALFVGSIFIFNRTTEDNFKAYASSHKKKMIYLD